MGDYILDIVFATREPDRVKGLESLKEQIQVGASPRATLALNKAARANALVHGRAYATPQDVKEIVHDVLRHRILLTYEAEAEEVTSEMVIDKIISVIRSREISVSLILQSMTQIRSMYGDAANTIVDNCDHVLYLGAQNLETAEFIGTRAFKTAEKILCMPKDSAYILEKGKQASLVKKIQPYSTLKGA